MMTMMTTGRHSLHTIIIGGIKVESLEIVVTVPYRVTPSLPWYSTIMLLCLWIVLLLGNYFDRNRDKWVTDSKLKHLKCT